VAIYVEACPFLSLLLTILGQSGSLFNSASAQNTINNASSNTMSCHIPTNSLLSCLTAIIFQMLLGLLMMVGL